MFILHRELQIIQLVQLTWRKGVCLLALFFSTVTHWACPQHSKCIGTSVDHFRYLFVVKSEVTWGCHPVAMRSKELEWEKTVCYAAHTPINAGCEAVTLLFWGPTSGLAWAAAHLLFCTRLCRRSQGTKRSLTKPLVAPAKSSALAHAFTVCTKVLHRSLKVCPALSLLKMGKMLAGYKHWGTRGIIWYRSHSIPVNTFSKKQCLHSEL